MSEKENDNFGVKIYTSPTSRVIGKDFWKFYNARVKKSEKIERYTMDRITRKFLRRVSDNMVNQPSGVYLSGIGYFYIHETFDTNYYGYSKTKRYYPAFIPEARSCLKRFTFDFRFYYKIDKGIKIKEKQGARYLNWTNAIFKRNPNVTITNKI